MITAEKPPLDEDLLVHFGIKGMKWGVRKRSDSDGNAKPKMSTKKKVAIGATVAVGAAAVAYILATRGQGPKLGVSKVSLKPNVMDRLREAQKMKVSNFNKIAPHLNKMHYFDPKRNTFVMETAPSKALDLIRR